VTAAVSAPPYLAGPAIGESANSRRSMLSRGLSILECFGRPDTSLTLTEVARRTDLPKATAFRLVAELIDWGLIDRDGTDLYLGHRVAGLAGRLPRTVRVVHQFLPYTRRLGAALDRQVVITMRGDDRALHFDGVEGYRIKVSELSVRDQAAACTGAATRALEAFRSETATGNGSGSGSGSGGMLPPYRDGAEMALAVRRGYALSRLGDAVAVAVPIRNAGHGADGALSTTLRTRAHDREVQIQRLVGAGRTLTDLYARLMRGAGDQVPTRGAPPCLDDAANTDEQ
jgi:DNA-binding IclR family transcriptional regulator